MLKLVAAVAVLSVLGGQAQDAPPSGPPQTISESSAHFDSNTEVKYYDLGMNTNFSIEDPTAPSDNPVWILVRGFQTNSTKPILVDGQIPIFGSLPGQSGYSDIRRISWVIVDDKYVTDTWKSLEDISGNVSITQTPAIFVNMAIVPNGTMLTGQSPFPVRLGYYRGQKIAFVSAGVTLPIAPPAYLFFKPGAKVPSGKPVVSVIPGNVNYTGFWEIHQVSVPADYVDDSIKTASDAASLPHKRTGHIANWPIVAFNNGDLNMTAAPSPGDPSRSPAPSKSSSQSSSASTPAPNGSPTTTKSAAIAFSMAMPTLIAVLAVLFY